MSLRLCCGALKCTPVGALEVECGIPPLDLHRKFITEKLMVKYKHKCVNPANECFEDSYHLHYGKYNEHFKPVILKTKELFKKTPHTYFETVVDTVPPWLYEPSTTDIS